MVTATKTERGRTVLSVKTDEEFQQTFGRMLDDRSIDIEAPQELFEMNGIFDPAEEHGLLDQTD